MTAVSPSTIDVARRAALGQQFLRTKAAALLSSLIGLWVFSGGFVMFEPAPYELIFLAALGLSIFAGMKLHRETLPLLYATLLFTPFAIIAVFQVRMMELHLALIYTLVTVFLMLTSYFVANFVADAPQRHMRLIVRAYIAVGLITAAIGTLAYLRLLPGADAFLLYGRAKALFKDPNVYGPFLMLPAMFALQRALLGQKREALWGGVIYLALFIGIFVSFSRGAWGHLAASSAMVFLLCFFLEARARDKVRMLLLAIGGTMALAAALLALLSIEEVASLFEQRFALTQSYDSGETGRFGRIGYAVELALANPWGIGPLEFSWLKIAEQPHNTYINVVHAYGWGGALAYFIFVGATLVRGATGLVSRSPNRLLLIPVYATFVPLVLLSGIIDTDHWRHYFLIAGLVWGICAGYRTFSPQQMSGRRVLA